MKIKFKNIISALLMAATAKVAANPTVSSSNLKLPVKDNNGEKELTKEKQNPLQKYIIKFRSDDSYLIAGHRSHSSHRSHTSHSSHRSSSSSYYTPSSSSSSSKKSSSSTSKSKSYSGTSSSSNSSNTATYPSTRTNEKTTNYTSPCICNIGERTILLGACGTDVKVLAALLVKHGYLAESDVITDAQGYTCCNEEMVTAIKKFQKEAGLNADGNAGAATIKALKNWKKGK